MKRVACFLFILIAFYTQSVFAYNYPNDFWTLNSKYEAALNSNNYADIIKYGNQIINTMGKALDGREKTDIYVTRYKEIAKAYAALGDYNNSAYTYNLLYNYASQYSEHWEYAKGAKAYALQYTPSIAMYTDKGSSPYFGAKNEKRNGVLFGMCANGGTRSKLKGESMLLTYQELGDHLLSYNVGIMREARSKGLAVEFALNCKYEGDDIKNIRNLTSYLKEISDMLDDFEEVPVYLRFAAEFDVWENQTDAESFKSAFRYVSKYFKDRNSNAAIVWSPAQASNWYVDIDDYYPGDEYVDWVGVSLYAQKYFRGDVHASDADQVVFKCGANSEPVTAIKDLVETYGNRKPIMLSESGCGHKLIKTGQDTSAFALQRLREYYSYLPMVYPQIKLIAYFDWYVDAEEEKSDYRLTTNSTLQNEYLKLTKGERFIHNGYSGGTGFCYRNVTDGISVDSVFPVSCYAHKYNTEIKTVTYFIDGNYVGMSNEIPYTAYIDASGYQGRHSLKAVAAFSDGQTLVTESAINISGNGDDISVKISGEKVDFDRDPVLYNDRTMVPMRKIFENLGARVEWDGASQTVTGTKGDRKVRVTVGSKLMYVNSKEITLDTSPIMMSDRTLVPVRAVAEGLGCDVDWIERTSTVEIEPKIFRWSEWTDELPGYVDEDLYYIEESEEYRYRTRDKEYFTRDRRIYSLNYVRCDTSYGNWSEWQRNYISETDNNEVETRTQSSPKRYHYTHYCTGNIGDSNTRYHSGNYKFNEACSYHDLGWFDSPLPYSEDSDNDYTYYENGNKYRCSNSCWRWYLAETSGGNYTEYRSRSVYRTYVYWEWGDWSDWSEWSDDDYGYYDSSVDEEERTVYRYKEK